MKDIMLRIVGRQIDINDEVSEETVEFMTEGKAYKKGGATYLVYEESEMSGAGRRKDDAEDRRRRVRADETLRQRDYAGHRYGISSG